MLIILMAVFGFTYALYDSFNTTKNCEYSEPCEKYLNSLLFNLKIGTLKSIPKNYSKTNFIEDVSGFNQNNFVTNVIGENKKIRIESKVSSCEYINKIKYKVGDENNFSELNIFFENDSNSCLPKYAELVKSNSKNVNMLTRSECLLKNVDNDAFDICLLLDPLFQNKSKSRSVSDAR